MHEALRKVDVDQEMKKTKRAARWTETKNINNNLATKRSEEAFRQVSNERAEDKRRVQHDMKKAYEY